MNTSLNFETKSEYSIRITTTDTLDRDLSKSIIIHVSDMNEPPADIDLDIPTLSAIAYSGEQVGILNTIDPDYHDTFTYTLVGGEGSDDNALFSIIGDKLMADTDLFVYDITYHVRIQTTDSLGLTYSKAFSISKDDMTGINTYAPKNIHIYPNPTHHVLKIKTDHTLLPCELKLYNIHGQMLLTKVLIEELSELNISQLPVGTYILQLVNNRKAAAETIFVKN